MLQTSLANIKNEWTILFIKNALLSIGLPAVLILKETNDNIQVDYELYVYFYIYVYIKGDEILLATGCVSFKNVVMCSKFYTSH